MFVGESGCWLVVGASLLYARMKPYSKSRVEYEPIPGRSRDSGDDSRDFDGERDALQPGVDPASKPLSKNDGDQRPLRGWRVILLAIPATCDIVATTFMNVGLLFVAASIYQMTRGALVLFVGLLSVVFLRHHLAPFKWLALVIVVAGVAVVGLAGAIEQRRATVPGGEGTQAISNPVDGTAAFAKRAWSAAANPPTPAAQTIIGVLLIAFAQIFTASQFVIEESIMHRYTLTPLAVVGWEGLFGFSETILGMLILHIAYGSTPSGRGGYFDVTTGWTEMTQNKTVAISSLLIMISIGGFNFFGLSVTRTVSATSRSTIDTCRTLFIWIVSLGLGWETFKWLQVVGFAGLVYGTFLFNEIVRPPRWKFWRQRSDGELLPERPIEHS